MMRVLIGGAAAQKLPAAPEELKWQDYSSEQLGALASTASLFEGARVFVLEGALYGARGDEFLDLAEALVESPHTFVLKEEKLLKRESERLAKAGVKVEHQDKTAKKEFTFDQFGVTAALGSRNKKALWLGLMAALRAGEKPEALAGLLAWKARAMGDAKLSRELTFLYHDAHRGMGELELLLERFALKL